MLLNSRIFPVLTASTLKKTRTKNELEEKRKKYERENEKHDEAFGWLVLDNKKSR